MKVTSFIPEFDVDLEIDSLLCSCKSLTTLPPFDTRLVDFVCDFSKSILLDKESRQYPELMVLANFFRASNIHKLENDLISEESIILASRGIVFHIAPSNVDSIFCILVF